MYKQLLGSQQEQRTNFLLSCYPLDMSFALTLAGEVLGANGVPYHKLYGPQAGSIVQYALAQWNAYLLTDQEEYREAFLIQAYWLLQNARLIQKKAAGWAVPIPADPQRCCLSATVQGCALSVVVRAYLLTQEFAFLQLMQLVFETFQLDILDGGIVAPIGEQGLWFEEYALYPAAHALNGMLFALLGIYEYSSFCSDRQTQVASIFERAFSTLRAHVDEFDCGYWVRRDLLQQALCTPEQLYLQVKLLRVLADVTGDMRCTSRVRRWQHYLQAGKTRLCFRGINVCQRVEQKIGGLLRNALFPRKPAKSNELRVCVPITAFPLTGGMRTILDKLDRGMNTGKSCWQMTYLTQRVGEQAEGYTIQRFGTRLLSPRQFPFVWCYLLVGWGALFWSLFKGASYDLILPQDGLFTAAFAAPLARLAGIRVVCIDHGNLAALPSELYRQERLQSLAEKHWLRQRLEPYLFSGYWPSLQLQARIAARFVDYYAIPGVAGDGIEEICRKIGVPASRLVRFVNTIDTEQYGQLDLEGRIALRAEWGIAWDAIVVTTICRLSPEKGVEIALQAMGQVLSQLSSELCTRVRFIIAGDGVSRSRLEEEIKQRGLGAYCTLWGEIAHPEAMKLHDLSDIYLYSGTRGGGYSLVMLEAMAAASAVIASNVPLANGQMLADERGIIVQAGDVAQTAQALLRLIQDEKLRSRLGKRARAYVIRNNTEEVFQRVWQRATGWSDFGSLVHGSFIVEERREDV